MNKTELIKLYKRELLKAFESVSEDKIIEFVEMVFSTYAAEKNIFAAGNGGTVSYIQNMVADFNFHPFTSEDKSKSSVKRNKFKCVNLCSDQSVLTGVTNDLGFEFVFSEQLRFQGEEDDIFIGMSGSGNSKNILQAMKVAKQKGMKTVLITRNINNKCGEFADLVLCVNLETSFPGQTGGNNSNLVYEDFLSSLTHIAVGMLKQKVQDEN